MEFDPKALLAHQGTVEAHTDEPTVVSAALRFRGVIISMPRPARHGHIFEAWGEQGLGMAEQGFLLSDGTFADRDTAWNVAKAAGQEINYGRNVVDGHLFSEGLW